MGPIPDEPSESSVYYVQCSNWLYTVYTLGYRIAKFNTCYLGWKTTCETV